MSADAAKLPASPRFRFRREYGLLLLFVVVFIGLSASVPYFFTPRNLLTVVRDQAHLGVLAVGMTVVILTRGIDLSVGSMVALSGVALGLTWKATQSAPAALAAAFMMGAVSGACNGLLISKGRIPPLIVTLATLSVFRGLAFALGGSESVGRFSPLILSWSRDDLLGLPAPLWTLAALFVGAGLYLSRTRGGRAIYAVGLNPSAARLSGVPVERVQLLAYIASGLLAALAAVLYAARNDSVRADIGQEYELLAITITVLGGTSVAGGQGSIWGTALGFLTLIFIENGIKLQNRIQLGAMEIPLPTEAHGVVVALLLIGALLLDAQSRRRSGAT